MNRGRRRYWWAALVAVIGLALQFVPWPKAWIDAYYMRGWFPGWSRAAAWVTDAFAQSLSVVALGLVLSALALTAAWALIAPRPRVGGGAWRRRASPWRPFLTLAAWVVALLLFWFPLGFGLAYRASSLGEAVSSAAGGQAGGTDRAVAEAWLVGRLHAAADALGPTALTAATGGVPAPQLRAAGRCIARSAEELRGAYQPGVGPVGVTVPERVKALPTGALLRIGYAGVLSPWLLEPQVDGGLPPTAALAVSLHELAHAAGFAGEADAEAAALTAGLGCDDPGVRYAATLRLAQGVRAGMSRDAAEAFAAAWPARALEDARAEAAASGRYRNATLERAANAVYDAFLRVQGREQGLADYGRGVSLALRIIELGGGFADAGGAEGSP